mmetsp:Transcript_877/g.3259  ORF Transcript_877/g.3259 Transcript_877/m.3259 type:complete len:208 (+) Transcript_877:939-1562(+)
MDPAHHSRGRGDKVVREREAERRERNRAVMRELATARALAKRHERAVERRPPIVLVGSPRKPVLRRVIHEVHNPIHWLPRIPKEGLQHLFLREVVRPEAIGAHLIVLHKLEARLKLPALRARTPRRDHPIEARRSHTLKIHRIGAVPEQRVVLLNVREQRPQSLHVGVLGVVVVHAPKHPVVFVDVAKGLQDGCVDVARVVLSLNER